MKLCIVIGNYCINWWPFLRVANFVIRISPSGAVNIIATPEMTKIILALAMCFSESNCLGMSSAVYDREQPVEKKIINTS